jgi:PST family polysaccharide transporter
MRESSSGLKQKTARGAFFQIVGQGANFVLRLGSMVLLARLVTPEHFGLVGMVTAITGLLNLMRDGGLPQATVQRAALTEDLVSTLFWLNLAIGVVLALLCAMAAPFVAFLYKEPRLLWVTVALGSGFLFHGASAQHRALLQRGMRFGTLVAIDIAALILSIGVGVWMAIAGLGYWALVGMALSPLAAGMIGVWLATGWMPRRPRRGTGARSMLRYGGMITVSGFVVYIAYNADKVLLGRFWGAEVLGVYGRAYQLISIPTENLHSAMSFVMFPALARVREDPQRLRNYFLKGYGLFLSVVLPITIACCVFASDIVRVLLGPQWDAAVPVFQLLAPTILAFAFLNPMAYLMLATGRALRSLTIAFLILPVVMLGYAIGLPSGPTGVALGFSVAMLLLLIPAVPWAKHGTSITMMDLVHTTFPPFVSTLVGAAAAMPVGFALDDFNAFVRLIVVTVVLFATHALLLLFVFGLKGNYLDMIRAMRGPREPVPSSEVEG